jgi:DnaJ-class molecular chaperone
MGDKLRIPAARCPACGHVSRDFDAIGQRCAQTLDGARCRGVIAGGMTYDDWQACPVCQATGRHDLARCRRCNGDGWLYVRSA